MARLPGGAYALLVLGLLLQASRAFFLAGIGTGDITGPVADVNLMGYAQPLQTAQGLHTRLYARAFLFADAADPTRRFAYVSMDACMASQLVTLRVVQRLQAEYGPDLYGPSNVAISGTHTHASPAGFLQYLLYDITSLGFVQSTFDAMVEGVLAAIRAAHASLRPASLSLASGDLHGASINRSPSAYGANPQEERDMYESDVDTDLTLLRLTDVDDPPSGGRGRGALGWFAVHCTSLNNTNRLVSGDNKAAAALAMERWAEEAEAQAVASVEGDAGVEVEGEEDTADGIAAAAAAAAASAALGLDLSAITGGGGGGGGGSAGSGGGGGSSSEDQFRFQLRSGGRGEKTVTGGAGSSSSSGGGGGGSRRGLLRFDPGFVAAVAQGSVGDTSPNTGGAFCLDTGLPCEPFHSTCNGRNELCHGHGPAWPDDRASAALIGGRQFEAARRLYAAAGGQLSGPLDFRSSFLDMSNTSVQPGAWTRGGRTCPPAMGMSFAAGTTDGPGAFDFTQGDTRGPPLWRLVMGLVLPPSPQQRECQAPKPILLDTGQITVPYLWQPRVTQVSLLRLGRLLIACLPGEPTTMAGRRIKRALADRFAAAAPPGSGAPVVVVSGLTGTYSSYITTWEEYQVQRYEGASTLYGPHTLDAYIQELLSLADAMLEGRPVSSAVQPPDLQFRQISLLAPVVLDWVPPGSHFGQATQQAAPSYSPGQTASATFRAANPRNNLRTNATFMAVERLQAPAPGTTTAADSNADASEAGAMAGSGPGRGASRRSARADAGAEAGAVVVTAAMSAAAEAEAEAEAESTGLRGTRGGVDRQRTLAARSSVAAGSAAAVLAGASGGGGGGGSSVASTSASDGVVASACEEQAGGLEGEWRVVADDRDWVTRFHWHRPAKLSPESYATLAWDIPPATPPGTYRFRYRGDARSLAGVVRPFEGCSAPFEVEETEEVEMEEGA